MYNQISNEFPLVFVPRNSVARIQNKVALNPLLNSRIEENTIPIEFSTRNSTKLSFKYREIDISMK